MMPTIARKQVTLSSGGGYVDLGFKPDHVEILNHGALSSIASGDTVQAVGKPDQGSSSAQILGYQVNTGSGDIKAVGLTSGEIKAHGGRAVDSNGFAGIQITNAAGFASSADLTVIGYRSNK